MKRFWDSKAREHAAFYIACWRGYKTRDLDGFFLASQDVEMYLVDAGFEREKAHRMLEIGCGIGRMTAGFAHHFSEVHAIDVSSEMIRQAQRNLADLSNVFLYETDGASLAPFPDDYFDFCFSFIVFQHIPSRSIIENYIKEVGRALVTGGIFHFQVNGLPDTDADTPYWLLQLKKVYRKHLRAPCLTAWRWLNGLPRGFEAAEWRGTTMTRKQIEGACAESGLEITNVVGEGTQYMWITAHKLD
jgi:SAM-dependent methyltransferase